MQDNKVQLFIYDVSHGMAERFSQALIGKKINAIYHTSLVVFGKEFYFAGGICYDPPRTTPFGHPIEVKDHGTTELTAQDFFDFIQSVKSKYTLNSYHILNNNCNHFTNEMIEFLTGDPLPDYILNQAKEYQNTPIGKLMEGFNVNPNNNQDGYNLNYNGFQAQNNQQQMGYGGMQQQMGYGGMQQQMGFGGNQQFNMPQTAPKNELIKDISDIMKFMELTQDNDKVVVDFYANWCPPCKRIKPVYGQLATDYKGKIVFSEVDVDRAKDISMNLNITAMPTFIFYKGGKEIERLKGANEAKLREALEKLNNA